jgi:hypothetical protein
MLVEISTSVRAKKDDLVWMRSLYEKTPNLVEHRVDIWPG